LVFAGAPLHESGGEVLSPSQVYFAAIDAFAANAEDVRFIVVLVLAEVESVLTGLLATVALSGELAAPSFFAHAPAARVRAQSRTRDPSSAVRFSM
jgi:hypothetical protein